MDHLFDTLLNKILTQRMCPDLLGYTYELNN